MQLGCLVCVASLSFGGRGSRHVRVELLSAKLRVLTQRACSVCVVFWGVWLSVAHTVVYVFCVCKGGLNETMFRGKTTTLAFAQVTFGTRYGTDSMVHFNFWRT